MRKTEHKSVAHEILVNVKYVSMHAASILDLSVKQIWWPLSLICYEKLTYITKTHPFKYIENFTTKTESFQIKILFVVFLLKT